MNREKYLAIEAICMCVGFVVLVVSICIGVSRSEALKEQTKQRQIELELRQLELQMLVYEVQLQD